MNIPRKLLYIHFLYSRNLIYIWFVVFFNPDGFTDYIVLEREINDVSDMHSLTATIRRR